MKMKMKLKPKFKVGDWVVVMAYSLVPLDIDASTYDGVPCAIVEVKSDRAILKSPLKVCYGKPGLDSAPLCQLVKISEKEATGYVEQVLATDTYKITRTRCG